MRVTQQMLNNNMLANMQRNLQHMSNTQEQMATGRKINRPSDDPVGLNYSLRYRSELSALNQYERNLDSAISWLDYGETTIGQANDVLQRVRDLAVQGATDSNSDRSRESIASEVDELYEQLMDIANSRFNGKYVFNGEKINEPPYPDTDDYQHADFDEGEIRFEVSRGVIIDVNFHAGEIFGGVDDNGDPESDNAFHILRELSAALRAEDQEAVDEQIGLLDSRMDKMTEKWTDLGARRNRAELIENRNTDEELNVTTLLSNTEDADVAELIMKLLTEENVLRASLSTGARIIQPSLIDFLR